MGAALGRLSSKELQQVIEDPLVLELRDDAAELVPELPPQSFVRMARTLRNEGRLDLIMPHGTADQLSSLFDLDVWKGDHVDVARARTWLVAIVDCYQIADRPRGELTDLMYQMDPEMWTLALFHDTVIVPLDPIDDDEARAMAIERLEGMLVYETPDGFFLLGVPDDENGRRVLHVLERVYMDSLEDGRRLVISIHQALVSQLEDDLLRWRSGRLADLGFVDWEEAMRLFRPLDRDAALGSSAPATDIAREVLNGVPTTDLVPGRSGELLRRVMDHLDSNEHGVRTREFMLLVNEVMAAQRFNPGDDRLQDRAIRQTQATVSLGLEMLATARSGHVNIDDFLAQRVAAIGLRSVFRVGYGALDKLRTAALSLHRGGRISLARVGSLLDRPWGPALAGLARVYPELALEYTSANTRPLSSLRDVAVGTELIARASALATLAFHADGYAIDPVWLARADEPDKLVLGDLIRTTIIHHRLPGTTPGISLVPLLAPDVAWAAEHMLESGRLAAGVRDEFLERCTRAGVGEHAGSLADNLLRRLEVELGSLEYRDGMPDLTRVGGLLTVQQVGMWLPVSQDGAQP